MLWSGHLTLLTSPSLSHSGETSNVRFWQDTQRYYRRQPFYHNLHTLSNTTPSLIQHIPHTTFTNNNTPQKFQKKKITISSSQKNHREPIYLSAITFKSTISQSMPRFALKKTFQQQSRKCTIFVRTTSVSSV